MTEQPQRKLDGYGPEDMALATWTLLQHTGGEWPKSLGGEPGQFHNTGSDEIVDELNIIVVDILMGRARWSLEISDAGPLCASMDAKSNLSVEGDDCTKCEFRLETPWSTDATERRKMCCLNYTILGITPNDHMPCIIRAHGISALPVRQLISQLRLNRQLKNEYFRAIINIKSQEKTSKYGTAYALHPKIVELITDETKAQELKIESNRLLGTPLALAEARPEEETGPEPLGYTPMGTPFYSEKERDWLIAKEATPVELSPPAEETAQKPAEETTAPAAEVSTKTPPAVKETEPKKEEKKEQTKKPLDLDI